MSVIDARRNISKNLCRAVFKRLRAIWALPDTRLSVRRKMNRAGVEFPNRKMLPV
jgi:hypothetical protein